MSQSLPSSSNLLRSPLKTKSAPARDRSLTESFLIIPHRTPRMIWSAPDENNPPGTNSFVPTPIQSPPPHDQLDDYLCMPMSTRNTHINIPAHYFSFAAVFFAAKFDSQFDGLSRYHSDTPARLATDGQFLYPFLQHLQLGFRPQWSFPENDSYSLADELRTAWTERFGQVAPCTPTAHMEKWELDKEPMKQLLYEHKRREWMSGDPIEFWGWPQTHFRRMTALFVEVLGFCSGMNVRIGFCVQLRYRRPEHVLQVPSGPRVLNKAPILWVYMPKLDGGEDEGFGFFFRCHPGEGQPDLWRELLPPLKSREQLAFGGLGTRVDQYCIERVCDGDEGKRKNKVRREMRERERRNRLRRLVV